MLDGIRRMLCYVVVSLCNEVIVLLCNLSIVRLIRKEIKKVFFNFSQFGDNWTFFKKETVVCRFYRLDTLDDVYTIIKMM